MGALPRLPGGRERPPPLAASLSGSLSPSSLPRTRPAYTIRSHTPTSTRSHALTGRPALRPVEKPPVSYEKKRGANLGRPKLARLWVGKRRASMWGGGGLVEAELALEEAVRRAAARARERIFAISRSVATRGGEIRGTDPPSRTLCIEAPPRHTQSRHNRGASRRTEPRRCGRGDFRTVRFAGRRRLEGARFRAAAFEANRGPARTRRRGHEYALVGFDGGCSCLDQRIR